MAQRRLANLVTLLEGAAADRDVRWSKALCAMVVALLAVGLVTFRGNYAAYGYECPAITISWTPTNPVAGEPVHLVATCTRPGEIASWEWSIREYSPYPLAFPNDIITEYTGREITHTFSYKGSHLVKVCAIERTYGIRCPDNFSIQIGGAPPDVSFTWAPANPTVGEETVITATAVDPDGGPIVYWSWNFEGAQGSCASDENVARCTFTSSECQRVFCTAVDETGAYGIHREYCIPVGDPPCEYGIYPYSRDFESSEGSVQVNVTTQSECDWTASSPEGWVHVLPASGTGNGAVTVSVDPNTGPVRQCDVTIAGVPFGVTQNNPRTCTHSVDLARKDFPAPGGSVTVGITTQAGCSWTASSAGCSGVSVTPTHGTGSGAVTITAEANPGEWRSCTLDIAGNSFHVTQEAAPRVCTFAISRRSWEFSSTGGETLVVTVDAPSPCSWDASCHCDWVTVQPLSGVGTGMVLVKADPNPGSRRDCTLWIAGRSLAISQQGAADAEIPNLSLPCSTPSCSGETGNISFSWSATDDVTPAAQIQYSHKLDDGSWTSWSGSTSRSYSGVPEGTHTFTLQAKDAAGRVAERQCTFTVGCNAPANPCASIGGKAFSNPTYPLVGEEAILHAEVLDCSDCAVSWEFEGTRKAGNDAVWIFYSPGMHSGQLILTRPSGCEVRLAVNHLVSAYTAESLPVDTPGAMGFTNSLLGLVRARGTPKAPDEIMSYADWLADLSEEEERLNSYKQRIFDEQGGAVSTTLPGQVVGAVADLTPAGLLSAAVGGPSAAEVEDWIGGTVGGAALWFLNFEDDIGAFIGSGIDAFIGLGGTALDQVLTLLSQEAGQDVADFYAGVKASLLFTSSEVHDAAAEFRVELCLLIVSELGRQLTAEEEATIQQAFDETFGALGSLSTDDVDVVLNANAALALKLTKGAVVSPLQRAVEKLLFRDLIMGSLKGFLERLVLDRVGLLPSIAGGMSEGLRGSIYAHAPVINTLDLGQRTFNLNNYAKSCVHLKAIGLGILSGLIKELSGVGNLARQFRTATAKFDSALAFIASLRAYHIPASYQRIVELPDLYAMTGEGASAMANAYEDLITYNAPTIEVAGFTILTGENVRGKAQNWRSYAQEASSRAEDALKLCDEVFVAVLGRPDVYTNVEFPEGWSVERVLSVYQDLAGP